ncbi:MAG TPA: SBBP repeat-containing protein [Pyrinomonadaceae bacterium]
MSDSEKPKSDSNEKPKTSDSIMRMKFVGANRAPHVTGADELPGKNNYLIGNDPRKWRTNVPTYAKVKYESVYPGVDAIFYGNQRQIEYDFIVAPGADPKIIKLGFQGAKALNISPDGDLVLQTNGSEIRQSKPVIYQETDGIRRNVKGSYLLIDKTMVAFKIGDYDHSRPLVIDPVLVYSTFLGGSLADAVQDVAVDAAGNTYLTGYTTSINFPHAGAVNDSSHNGGDDVFVTKLNATGTTALYSTYLGGSNDENGLGIALDSLANAYITGLTRSPNFPITPGVADSTCQSTTGPGGLCAPFPHAGDAFVTKLNGTGAIAYSTFVGGLNYEQAHAIAVDGAGNAYITGQIADGFSCTFPTVNGYDNCANSYYDAFLTKLNSTGTAFLYSTTLGGFSDEYGASDITVDNAGNAFIAGPSRSSNFPITPGAYSACGSGGSFDAFAAKINTNASGAASLAYSTCVGGSADDGASGIDIDSAGNIWLTGNTSSTNFPTVNSFDSSANGGGDAFLAKLNPFAAGASQLVYSSYLGGSGGDGGSDVRIDGSGNVYVVGTTGSTNFPTADPLQLHQGGNDAFVTKLNHTAAGSAQLLYSTYLGGCNNDSARRVAVDFSDNAYVIGGTNSPSFPTTTGTYQNIYGGSGDGFVAKISGSGQTTPVIGCGSADSDGDGVANSADNCPNTSNPDQADTDGDGIGNVCDPTPNGDTDNDGVDNNSDNCPNAANPAQTDTDNDGIGDACDPKQNDGPTGDSDNDGVLNNADNCPSTANPDQLDTDADGQGNACDTDDDNDGVTDADETTADSDPLNPASKPEVCDGTDNDLDNSTDEGFTNTDGDNQADCVDSDDDNDGVSDVDEITAGSDPLNAASKPEICDGVDNDLNNEVDEGFVNTDGDSQADCVDADDDNDGVFDADEAAAGSDPLNPNSKPEVCDGADNDLNEGVDEGFANTDGDTQADCVDSDDDNDGQSDADEQACGSNPLDANSKSTDTDNDGKPNCVDADDDGDGVPDTNDNCPLAANPDQANADGDAQGDVCDADDDNDGVPDGTDLCPATPANTAVNANGCPDADRDGVADTTDNCPFTANPDQRDTNGDGVGDVCTPFGLPTGGQFVIGDLVNQSAGATVNFWGSQWLQNNPMSGGSAPNSFKGFENGNALPHCGSTWTSQPGNSSNPPPTIPQYMAVIVSSSVQKNGSVITGNVRRIIIVKTNPGYGPSPGHWGTGEVVAILCTTP